VNAQKTLVTIATYNEIENLPRLADEIFAEAPAVDLLVIDDGSPDGTGNWCDRRGAEDPRVQCLHRSGKQGLGTAILAGLQYAIDHDYQFVVNMDADFSHHPRYLPSLIAGMNPPHGEPLDVMIGSRYVHGGGITHWPLKRRLMSKAVNFYSRWLLGLNPRDCSGGYRCYRVALLKQLDFSQLSSRGYSFQEEILWRLKMIGARFGETPIVFADREKGQSKIHSGEAFAAIGVIFRLGLKNLFSRRRPLPAV